MNELTMLGLEEQFRRTARWPDGCRSCGRKCTPGRMTPFAASRELLALFRRPP